MNKEELQKDVRERFREYFSANALDGEDIGHKGTMIAPSLAVDVTDNFLDEVVSRVWEVAQEEAKNIDDLYYDELYDQCAEKHTKIGYLVALEAMEKILLDEVSLAQTTKSGKTSRLTSAIIRISRLKAE